MVSEASQPVAEAKCNRGSGLINRDRNLHTRLFTGIRTGSRDI